MQLSSICSSFCGLITGADGTVELAVVEAGAGEASSVEGDLVDVMKVVGLSDGCVTLLDSVDMTDAVEEIVDVPTPMKVLKFKMDELDEADWLLRDDDGATCVAAETELVFDRLTLDG